ncbi:hypothetical protein ACJX0J_030728, partial [Zea mays]
SNPTTLMNRHLFILSLLFTHAQITISFLYEGAPLNMQLLYWGELAYLFLPLFSYL